MRADTAINELEALARDLDVILGRLEAAVAAVRSIKRDLAEDLIRETTRGVGVQDASIQRIEDTISAARKAAGARRERAMMADDGEDWR